VAEPAVRVRHAFHVIDALSLGYRITSPDRHLAPTGSATCVAHPPWRLGVGQTSNYNQSNSWAPRLRQAYLDYDNTGYGFHLLAGQAWSLLTQNQAGITPRKENIPLTIDANYVVGFNYTRNWQIRMVEEFSPAFSAGISVEAPAAID
jgi:hypothetical protein